MKNTKEKGLVTHFIYWSKDRYIGVCLELDIVDEDKDKDLLIDRLRQQTEAYVKYICSREDFDESLLNRPAPKRYWDRFGKHLEVLAAEAKAASKPVRKSVPKAKRPFDSVIWNQTIPVCA